MRFVLSSQRELKLMLGLYSDVMCWMQGHLLVSAFSFLVIMDSDTSSSSSVIMSYDELYRPGPPPSSEEGILYGARDWW